ncbi:Sodium/hydrogen exchanger [Aspergillus ambiguus]|uniref:cation:proton antiporter n=1 Tax=Aspergillus ambiguus TaxID=176160 RepID=UPI003CCD1BF8
MAGDQAAESAFAYHEPPIATVLNQAGFLVVLNVVNVCLDKLLYCGLIGQLFIGILWGTPGANWLDREMETVIQQLGYLGLIMLVYEGGLSTSIKSLRANLLVSLSVAITGIGAPMGLSFVLKELVGATSLQAFAAGAALSATSLGTTFKILSTTQLISTRLGTVTASAAMLDDVVGLVMVQIISNLGGNAASFSATTVVRPVFVSIGFAIGLLLLCLFGLRPILRKLLAISDKMPKVMGTFEFAFVAHTCILVGIVGGATCAGTSSLFAAYLAGVIISWIDGMAAAFRDPRSASGPGVPQTASDLPENASSPPVDSSDEIASRPSSSGDGMAFVIPTGAMVYDKYYKGPVNRVFTPLFFASIGFAIPITEMFHGEIVWRGVVYAILMTFGKIITGLWLIRFSSSARIGKMISLINKPLSYGILSCVTPKRNTMGKEKGKQPSESNQSASEPMASSANNNQSSDRDEEPAAPAKDSNGGPQDPQPKMMSSKSQAPLAIPPKPKSLYPPTILGLAMVARGEIGYLIASLAESQGIFSKGSSSDGPSETYLVIIWAISLCTLIGPISVGTLVKRVKKLQQSRVDSGGPDPLGVWGI